MLEGDNKGVIGARSCVFATAAVCLLGLTIAAGLSSQEAKRRDERAAKATTDAMDARSSAAGMADGRQLFETRCAACHGLDGRGGERAPDIATRATVQQRSDEEIAHIVQTGIPAGGMPGFATIDVVTLPSLVAYLRFLQGKSPDGKLPGTPENGKLIFFGRGRCAECHIVAGKGGFIASDLSAYGRTRAVEEIREAIVKPQRSGRQAALVEVTTVNGQKYLGVARNEDNFSVQLQSLDGTFHLVLKPEIETLTKQSGPLMPADYGSKLNAKELDDLVSFLMVTARNGEATAVKKEFIEDEENE